MNELKYTHVYVTPSFEMGVGFDLNKEKVFFSNSSSVNDIFFNGTSAASMPKVRNYCELDLTESYKTMLASQNVLARDWNHPDEDAAWANL